MTELERAARADGVAQIISQLDNLPLVEGVPLSAWPDWTPQREVRLREKALPACVFDNYRVDGEGRARVLVTLPLAAVQIEEEGWPRLVGGVLVAVGHGDPRAIGGDSPAGWEHVSPRGRELAAQAAREIVRDTLTHQVQQELGKRDFMPPDDIAERVKQKIESPDPVFEPYQLCRVAARLTLSEVVPGLAAGPREGVKKAAGADADIIEATGYAAPPVRTQWAAESTDAPAPPAWAERRLRATGRGAGSAADPAGREAAEKAARIDALIKMAREVDRLPLAGEQPTVREFLLTHAEDDDAWSAFLTAGRTVDSAWEGDTCTITLEWDLGTLWALIEHR